MPNLLRRIAALLAAALFCPCGVRADTFEVVDYVPPAGWQPQSVEEGRAFVRPDGTGIITFSASSFDNPDVAFGVTWRELVEPAVPGPAPSPQTRRQGDFIVASGAREARSPDKAVAVTLVTVTGRGHRYAIVGMGGNEQALRELSYFFDTLALSPAASAPAPSPNAADLLGRWWKSAGASTSGNIYYWYKFSNEGHYVWETPLNEPRAGTFQVRGNRITLTQATGESTSREFAIECVGSRLYLEFSDEAGGYWHSDRRC